MHVSLKRGHGRPGWKRIAEIVNTHASEFAELDGLEGGLSSSANNRKSAVMMATIGRICASFARFGM